MHILRGREEYIIADLCVARFTKIQAVNPDGRSFASGAEDGYIRLHFFDKSYLDMKDPVPEEEDDPVEEEDHGDDDEGNPATE